EGVSGDLGDLLAGAVDQTVCGIVPRHEPCDTHAPRVCVSRPRLGSGRSGTALGPYPGAVIVLDRATWRTAAEAHEVRAEVLTGAHRTRRVQGRSHPVADFLFVYYRHSPARLRRWHPGPDVALLEAAGEPIAGWRHFRTEPDGSVRLD